MRLKYNNKVYNWDNMEFVNVSEFDNCCNLKVIKKVPILTDQLMATVLLIEPNTTLPSHTHKDLDEIHYVIEGAGKITIGKNSREVDEGLMIVSNEMNRILALASAKMNRK